MHEETYWKMKADAERDAWHETPCEECNGTLGDHEFGCEEWECGECGNPNETGSRAWECGECGHANCHMDNECSEIDCKGVK